MAVHHIGGQRLGFRKRAQSHCSMHSSHVPSSNTTIFCIAHMLSLYLVGVLAVLVTAAEESIDAVVANSRVYMSR